MIVLSLLVFFSYLSEVLLLVLLQVMTSVSFGLLTKAESVEVILQYCTAYAVLRNKRAFVERIIGFYSQCTR